MLLDVKKICIILSDLVIDPDPPDPIAVSALLDFPLQVDFAYRQKIYKPVSTQCFLFCVLVF